MVSKSCFRKYIYLELSRRDFFDISSMVDLFSLKFQLLYIEKANGVRKLVFCTIRCAVQLATVKWTKKDIS